MINAREMCELLSKMNITNNHELEMRRKELESTLSGLTVDDLRDNVFIRQDVTSSVDEILKKISL